MTASTSAQPGPSTGPSTDPVTSLPTGPSTSSPTVPERWDLIVVGAGPAGTSTALGALYADPSLRVLLLDRADFPRDKCCGDGIAPHVFDALERVGVRGVDAGWTPLTRLELARGDSVVSRPMARPVWVIPREVFDARLVERAVAAGAVLVRHRVGSLHRVGDEVVIDDRYRAPVVVAADGAHSVVRTWLTGAAASSRRALAIRGYAPTPPGREGTQIIRYGNRRQPAYAWAFDRGDGLSNVGYGELLPGPGPGHGKYARPSGRRDGQPNARPDAQPDMRPNGRRDGQPNGTPSRQLLLDELERLLPGSTEGGDHWRGHHLPLSGWRWRQPEGPVLLVGDAAGLINPMTGEGIYYAVATGLSAGATAARSLAEGDASSAGARHQRGVRRLLATHLRHTWTASRLAAVPAVVEAGIRAARRNGRTFDDLVEIGLGDGLITPRLVAGMVGSLVTSRGPSGVPAAGPRSPRPPRPTGPPR